MKLCLICNFQTASEKELCPKDGSSMVTVGDDPLLGFIVEGHYRIDSVIGQGSAGTVYRATQELIGRQVAIKVLHEHLLSDREFHSRFVQEAKAVSRLSHPNIITIYDFGVIPQSGRPYIAMDLLSGTPLSQLIHERGSLTPDEAIPIFKQVCEALGEAHRQGVIHRDVKPENIVLIERDGHKWFPIVVDFGIARLIQEESEHAKITRTGTVCGSPTYMSPEQCTSSKVDHLSDIYSLGIVIYETLTGEAPFISEDVIQVMSMHVSETPKPLNAVKTGLSFPQALVHAVSKALFKNPQDRFQNMDEFATTLQEALPTTTERIINVSSRAPHELSPGPLAKSEELKARHWKEVAVPRLNSHELACRALSELSPPDSCKEEALEELKAKGALLKSNIAFSSDKLAASNNSAQVKGVEQAVDQKTNPVMSRLTVYGFQRSVAVVVLIVIVAGVMTFAVSQKNTFTQKEPQSKNLANAEVLIKQGKLTEALATLRTLQQQDKMTGTQSDSLNKILLGLAKNYAKNKEYTKAISVLEQISPKSGQAETARALIKKYRHIK